MELKSGLLYLSRPFSVMLYSSSIGTRLCCRSTQVSLLIKLPPGLRLSIVSGHVGLSTVGGISCRQFILSANFKSVLMPLSFSNYSMYDMQAKCYRHKPNNWLRKRKSWKTMPGTKSNFSSSGSLTQLLTESVSSVSNQEPARKTYIALGSNVGDRIGNIEDACRELNSAGIKVLRTSALYETQPMYVVDQDPFINGVCEVGTSSIALQLLVVQTLNTCLRLMQKGIHL